MISDFMLEFEDELFNQYRNTSNYHTMRRPQKPRKSSTNEEPLDPSEEAFLKKTMKELVSIISNELLEESELSFTTRDVYINDALLSSLKTPKSSHILFYDEFVTIWYSSLNARHILPTVMKRLFSS